MGRWAREYDVAAATRISIKLAEILRGDAVTLIHLLLLICGYRFCLACAQFVRQSDWVWVEKAILDVCEVRALWDVAVNRMTVHLDDMSRETCVVVTNVGGARVSVHCYRQVPGDGRIRRFEGIIARTPLVNNAA